MSALDRAYWLAVAIVAYLGVASMPGGGSWWARLLPPVLIPLALAWLWTRTQRAPKTPDVDPSALKTLRLCGAGALIWVQSRLAAPQQPALELAAALACGACSVAATYALARIPARPGLLKPPPSALSIDAAAFSGLLWGAAATVAAARLIVPASTLRLDPLTLDYANTAASIGSLLVLLAAAWRVRVVRKLELGVADRAAGALALTVTALSVAIPVAAIDVAAPDRALPAAVVIGSLCCIWTVVVPDATRVSSTLRGTLAVMMLGVPVALIAAVVSQQAVGHSGAVALLGCAGTLLVGLIARELARPLGPEQSRWLSAISEASQKALVPEPRAAVVATLQALKKTSASPKAKPELWRLDPPGVLSVDVAGYLTEKEAEVPERICTLGIDEPERTLRVETLRALQVRRPDIRDLLDWFEVRGAFSATVIVDDDGASGFVLLPRGDRSSLMTLEEARSVRLLADRISALFSVTASLARARQREVRAQRQADHFEAEFRRVQSVSQGDAERHARFAQSLARPLLTAAYSAATRLALSELERFARNSDAVVLQAPLGVDVTAWAAVLHCQGHSKNGPLLIVDASMESDDALELWSDADRSVVALARGGSLFVRDIQLLPLSLQDALANLLTLQAEQPSELSPAKLLVSVTLPLSELVRRGLLSAALAPLLSRQQLILPSLSERAEDLRSMILDVVGRTPAGHGGGALGIERRALQALLDYPWPGNDAELHDVVSRAAQMCSGARVDIEDLQAIGFAGLLEEQLPPAPFTSIPPPPSGRADSGIPSSPPAADPAHTSAASRSPMRSSSPPPSSSAPSDPLRRRRSRPPRRRRH